MSDWDGRERRQEMQNLTINLATLTERVGNLINALEKHIEITDERLTALEDKVWGHAKFIYMGLGIFAVINILLKFWQP
jgi:hypothetical protein